MFVIPRSAIAVILPLALLFAVVLWSNRGASGAARGAPPVQAAAAAQPAAAQPAAVDEVLAANLPSR